MELSEHPLAGLHVPLITPLAPNGAVDAPALARLATAVLDDGARGLVALGTTGEPSSLDAAERDLVVATCAAVCRARGARLIVGAGTNDTRETVARHEALGAVGGVTASLLVVPYYVRPSEAAVVRHVQHVAARSPVPVVVYNVPYRTGRGLGAEALLELAATENVIGLKQAVGALDEDTLRVLADAPPGFGVLGGDDAVLLPLVLMGAVGAIAASAHLCTARFVELIELGRRGEVARARTHAAALLPLVGALFAEPSPAILKAVLHAQGRIASPAVRMPLEAASHAGAARALGALDADAAVREICAACESMAGLPYDGEPVDQLQHALQTAALAAASGAEDEVVAAALLHDIARAPAVAGLMRDGEREHHGTLGSAWLAPRVGERAAWLAEQHVDAKRYLVATEPDYRAGLSPTSLTTLAAQGGPMTDAEVATAREHPDWPAAVALRRWDDAAKDPGLRVAQLDRYRPLLRAVVRARLASA